MTRLLPLALLACATTPAPSPTPENRTGTATAAGSAAAAASADPAADPDPDPDAARGRYVGREVGVEIVHIGGPPSTRQRLPSGLEALHTINVADGWHWTVAREGDDLVLLLIDARGVVVDDVTMPGRGDATVITGYCGDGFISIAKPKACDGQTEAAVDIAWGRSDSSLARVDTASCSCDTVNL